MTIQYSVKRKAFRYGEELFFLLGKIVYAIIFHILYKFTCLAGNDK